MRLIDADELKKALDNCDLTSDGGVDINDLFKIIDHASTIDAIPVEWIEPRFSSLRIAQMIIESWRAENETN